MANTATAPAPSDLMVTLAFAKETPGTYVFKTDEADAPIKQVYIAKGAFDGQPVEVTLTITL